MICHTKNSECLHTQTRPFKPTAISKETFFPKASRTAHVGELRSLQTQPLMLISVNVMHEQQKLNTTGKPS